MYRIGDFSKIVDIPVRKLSIIVKLIYLNVPVKYM